MKLIQYIGKKPSKADTIARTGLNWTPGQVHPVADDAALKLLGFPTVWSEVCEKTQTPPVLKRPR
jgi:hypothetical protein